MSVPARSKPAVPRLAFRVGEAARTLGVSDEHFARYIAPELRWIRLGAVKLVAREELEAWLRRSAKRTLDPEDEA